MRFCMVTTFYPPYHFGNDARFVPALARALVSEGCHVEVGHREVPGACEVGSSRPLW
jgi:hypothetical protein